MDAVDATTYIYRIETIGKKRSLSDFSAVLFSIGTCSQRRRRHVSCKSALKYCLTSIPVFFYIHLVWRKYKGRCSISEHRDRKAAAVIDRCCWALVVVCKSTRLDLLCVSYTRQKSRVETCVVVVVGGGGPAAIIRHSGRDELAAQRECTRAKQSEDYIDDILRCVCVLERTDYNIDRIDCI